MSLFSPLMSSAVSSPRPGGCRPAVAQPQVCEHTQCNALKELLSGVFPSVCLGGRKDERKVEKLVKRGVVPIVIDFQLRGGGEKSFHTAEYCTDPLFRSPHQNQLGCEPLID